MELEQQQKQQEVVMMTEPDDEVNSGLAVWRHNEPDGFISLVVAEFHLCCRLLNFKSSRVTAGRGGNCAPATLRGNSK